MKNLAFLILFVCVTFLLKANNSFIYGYIENKGQIIDQFNQLNNEVKFIAVCNGFKVQLKVNSFSYEVLKIVSTSVHEKKDNLINDSTIINSNRIDVELINSNPNPQIITERKSDDYLNYYTTGTPENGVTMVHYFSKVIYKNIYPYIDLEFTVDYTKKQPYKYNFIIHPMGDMNNIKLHYWGANKTELNNNSIDIENSSRLINECLPISYELESQKNIAVKLTQLGKDIFGFSCKKYNNHNTIIIDPWATYFGGDGLEQGYGTCCDNINNVYATGYTFSVNNIATSGAYQNVIVGLADQYVVKFDVNGARIWGTYFGGQDNENGYSIAIDSHNNIIIVGVTGSNAGIATNGAFQTIYAGGGDFFICKFNSSGFRKWSTYYGGNNGDVAYGVSVDNSDNIIVVGSTASSINVTTAGTHQTVFGGGTEDALIVKFDSSGSRLWATYYGGNNSNASLGNESAYSVATDNNDNIVVAGYTNSTNNISTIGAHQETLSNGLFDGFLVKFNSSGVRQWGTYYGGTNEDEIKSVAVDSNNNILISGHTASQNNIATPNSFRSTINANIEVDFIAKFSQLGARIWGTYFGGMNNGVDGNALAIGDSNSVILTGTTSSNDSIATLGSYKDTLTTSSGFGHYDAFIVKFDSNGLRQWGTYYGGDGDEDVGRGVAVSKYGNIYITGNTNSPIGIATQGTFQTLLDTVNGSNTDAFIASFSNSGQLTTIPSLSNPAKNSLLQVYPNPANDKITVSIKEYTVKGGSLVLMDVEGKVVKSTVVKSAECSLDVKDLSAGVYLLQYEDGEVCETVKFVKE